MIRTQPQSTFHRRARGRMTHRTSFGSDAFFCGFLWAQVVDSAHMSSSSDAILEAAAVPPDECTGRFERTHHTATTPRQCTQPHTYNHRQSQGQHHKVTLSRRKELGASRKKNHGSLAPGRQPSDGQPTHHAPEPRVKPHTTRQNHGSNHNPQAKTTGQTTNHKKTTVKPQRKNTIKPQKNGQTQKTTVKPRSCLVF